MDKAAFIKEIKNIFLDINTKEKKYSKVWLSEANFGGLYHSGTYTVNIKALHNIDIISDEIRSVVYMLHEKLDEEERKYLYTVNVYNVDEDIYDERGDIVLLNEESMV